MKANNLLAIKQFSSVTSQQLVKLEKSTSASIQLNWK